MILMIVLIVRSVVSYERTRDLAKPGSYLLAAWKPQPEPQAEADREFTKEGLAKGSLIVVIK